MKQIREVNEKASFISIRKIYQTGQVLLYRCRVLWYLQNDHTRRQCLCFWAGH